MPWEALVRFPALFAPASLKQKRVRNLFVEHVAFSGAFCAGLIEAGHTAYAVRMPAEGFPALFAPASLKHHRRERDVDVFAVFRRFLRRPH